MGDTDKKNFNNDSENKEKSKKNPDVSETENVKIYRKKKSTSKSDDENADSTKLNYKASEEETTDDDENPEEHKKFRIVCLHKETVTMLIITAILFMTCTAVIIQSGGYGLTADEIKKNFDKTFVGGEESSAVSENDSEDHYNYENPNITPGNILDCKGNILCDLSHFDGISDYGNYIDNTLYSPLIGWMNSSENGSSGLLNKYYKVLRDEKNGAFHGKDIYLTIDHDLQKKVRDIYAGTEGLGTERKGSAVVMDAESGELLACVAFPSYDISKWYENDINTMNQSPVTNRDPILPGSTFKLLTSVMLLEQGQEEKTFDTLPFNVEGTKGKPIINWYSDYGNAVVDQSEQMDYKNALYWSSNVFFAKMILDVKDGDKKLKEVCKRIHIGEDWELDFGTNVTKWLLDGNSFKDMSLSDKKYTIANTGYGQDGVLMSTVSNAMVGAAMCNGGMAPVPHMIKEVVNCKNESEDLSSLKIEGLSSEYNSLRLTSEENASKIYSAMLDAATNPSVIGFSEDENVAAKTGTAETEQGDGEWLVACKEINEHKYVVVLNQVPCYLPHSSDLKEPVREIFSAIEDITYTSPNE